MSDFIVGKTYGTLSASERKQMTGLEFLQGLADGSLPLNTMAQTLGYDVVEAANGRVVVTAKPNAHQLNPAGTVHGGLAATLLDSCMGLAIQRVSPRPLSNSRYRLCDPSRRTLALSAPKASC